MENYTFIDGNLTETSSSANYRYIYTYDESAYDATTSYCLEMPFNTTSIQRGGCWLLSNMPLFTDLFGKASKNRVSKIVITQNSSDYANIDYSYTLDENNLLSTVTMSGKVKGIDIPTDYVISFDYLKREQ